MKSTSEFKDDIIVDIQDLSIGYNVPHYPATSWRDSFINLISSPLDYFFKEDDHVLLLDNINLKVRRGDRLGILGNNGSGKTSLCRYICGIYQTQQLNKIKINGHVKGIFDTEVAVLPELSGHENLELLSHFFYPELSSSERKQVIKEIEEFCELGKFIDAPFKLYSKGMKARLFLSLVSSRPSNLLVLDEVFNGADYFFNEKITQRIKETIFSSGAVIFISHSNALIQEVCNRVIVFKDKKIVFDGSPDDGIKFYTEQCSNVTLHANS